LAKLQQVKPGAFAEIQTNNYWK